MVQQKVFKVVRILDEYRIAINAGTNEKVTKLCFFEVIGPRDEIVDPDTKESLGMLPNIKEIVKPVIIEEKFCVCECIDERVLRAAKVMHGNEMLFAQTQKLNVNKEQISKSDISGVISIGDKAIFISVEHKMSDDQNKNQNQDQDKITNKKWWDNRNSLLFSFA